MKLKIRKGDTVEIISGRTQDKGKKGEVIRVLPDESRIVVSGVNMRTKHQRQVQSQGKTIKPGIVKFEAPIDISNAMLICKKCNKPTRVAFSREGDKSQRVCKKCGSMIDA
jgi:large subunit ribosomal protein L24